MDKVSRIISTRNIKSSGLEYLDSKSIKSNENTSFYRYRENGV